MSAPIEAKSKNIAESSQEIRAVNSDIVFLFLQLKNHYSDFVYK